MLNQRYKKISLGIKSLARMIIMCDFCVLLTKSLALTSQRNDIFEYSKPNMLDNYL